MHGGQTAVAEALGVGKSTITAWVGKYPEFAKAVADGKTESNGRVLESAVDQAIGYYREVTELVKIRKQRVDEITGKTLVDEVTELRTYTKYFPPDPRMTQFVISNRFPKEYQKSPEPPEEKVDRTIEFAFENAGGEDYSK